MTDSACASFTILVRAYVSFPAFNSTHVIPIELSQLCELFLRKLMPHSQLAKLDILLLSIEGIPFCRIEASTQPSSERGALYIASATRTLDGLVLHSAAFYVNRTCGVARAL